MKAQAGPFPAGGDAGLGAAPSSAMSSRRVASLVVVSLLLVGLAGVAGYAGVASGLIASGDGSSTAPSARTGTTAVPPAPATADTGQGPEAAERSVGSGRPLQPGSRQTAGAPGSPPELRWPLWEFQLRQPIPPREPPLTPPPWRLVGSATTGPVKQLIILRQGKTAPEFYVKGDSLPGGYVVGEITDEDVTLIHGKRALLLSFIGIR